jgi:Cu-Zn family superoxide dismutase
MRRLATSPSRRLLAAPVAALVLAAASIPAAAAAADAPRARTELKDAKGKSLGTAALEETGDAVRIRLELRGLPPGPRAIHVHEHGRCEGPDFKSAGAHFNPGGKQHGLGSPAGHHAGDLAGLVVAEDGTARAELVARGATLREGPGSLLREGGTALVVHQGPDDHVSDPAGKAGDRIACGVIERER